MLLFLYLSGSGTAFFQDTACAAGVDVLTPRSGTRIIARNAETHLVLSQPLNAEECRVQVDSSGEMLTPVEVVDYDPQLIVHFILPLKSGENSFTIIPDGTQVKLKYMPLHNLLNSKSPYDDTYVFHRDSNLPEICQDCHDFVTSEVIEPIGVDSQPSCAECHKNVVDKGRWLHSPTVNRQCLACHTSFRKMGKVVHGPLSLGGCTLCHNPHGEDNRNLLWAEGSLQICISCHVDMRDLVSGKNRLPNVHGIIFGEGCTACHNPHSSDEEYMMLKPINRLCVGCHTHPKGDTDGHPVAGHPVEGPTEHHRPGKSLTCTSCHNPHGSMQKFMLIETLKGARLCHGCHRR